MNQLSNLLNFNFLQKNFCLIPSLTPTLSNFHYEIRGNKILFPSTDMNCGPPRLGR